MEPIKHTNKQDCCGCGACVVACPDSCITMTTDDEGFDYPVVNKSCCTQCGRCVEVCSMVQLVDNAGHREHPAAYACWHRDDVIRADSTSGGAFTALAEHALSQGAVVFGAAFEKGCAKVSHVAARTPQQLKRLRGSKYVQSSTVEAFREVREYVSTGRRVLFTGTPCQVTGLRGLLGPRTDRLWTCDLVCHGVPSPGVFAKYMAEQCRRYQGTTTAYSFRDKTYGWNFPSVRQVFDNGRAYARWNWGDPFTHGFLLNISLRPSCYSCPVVGFPRVADITLADYWGVGRRYPQYDDNRGTSLVLVNTTAGDELFGASAARLFSAECDLEHAVSHNWHLANRVAVPASRVAFFDAFRRGTFQAAALAYMKKTTLLKRACARIVRRAMWRMRSIRKPSEPA